MANPIIKIENVNPQEAPNYYEQAFVINSITKMASNKLNKKVSLMMEYYYDGSEVLYSDIEKDRVEFISSLADCYGPFVDYSKDASNEINVKTSTHNNIFFYKDLEIFVCQLSEKTPYGGRSINLCVFAANEKNTLKYVTYVSNRLKENNSSVVTIYTDGERGVNRKTEKITKVVEKEDVIMEDKLKTQIYRTIDQFFQNNGEFYSKYNIPYKRGILFYGNPGNGKTTLVKSIISSIDAPVIYWQVTEFTNSESISEVFESVARKAPAILVIEDIDSIPEKVRSSFLNVLDGVASKEGIFIIGTTNYPDKIDPALMNRAGRFDHAYEIEEPNKEMRKKYLVKKGVLNLISEDELTIIVDTTDKFSMSILNELYTTIALQVHYEGKANIEEAVSSLRETGEKVKTKKFFKDENRKVGFSIA